MANVPVPVKKRITSICLLTTECTFITVMFYIILSENYGRGRVSQLSFANTESALNFKKAIFVDVQNVQHYKMRAALKLSYSNIYAKLDGSVLWVQYLFKDLTGLYQPNYYLTTLYLGYECVLV